MLENIMVKSPHFRVVGGYHGRLIHIHTLQCWCEDDDFTPLCVSVCGYI